MATAHHRDVWADNVDAEFAVIREAIVNYPYVAMVRRSPPRPGARDSFAANSAPSTHRHTGTPPSCFPRSSPRVCRQDTEFPGVVARPIGSFKSSSDFHYQTLRCNVDLLKIIQIGLTLCNEEGQLAPGVCTFQFNFKFSLTCAAARLLATAAYLPRRRRRVRPGQHALSRPVLLRSEDMYSQDSINLLERSGLNFAEHEERGIDPIYFSELLISSGIVLCDDVKWISFHSGYDFGYLLKVLTCRPLPLEEDKFFEQLKLYFPQIYDIKHLMKSCENLKGGLNKLAEDLEVERIGPEHNAGSDSLLTQATFFKMRQLFFENELDDDKCLNCIHGLGKAYDQVS